MGERSAFATATARPKNDPQATPLRSRQQSQVFAALDSDRGPVGVDPGLEDALDDERPRLVAGDGRPAAGARLAQAAVEGRGTRSREDLFEGRSDQRRKGVGARGRETHLAPNVPGALLRQGLNVFDEPSRTSVSIVHLRSTVTKTYSSTIISCSTKGQRPSSLRETNQARTTHLGANTATLLKLLERVAAVLVHRKLEDAALEGRRVRVDQRPAAVVEAPRDEEVSCWRKRVS